MEGAELRAVKSRPVPVDVATAPLVLVPGQRPLLDLCPLFFPEDVEPPEPPISRRVPSSWGRVLVGMVLTLLLLSAAAAVFVFQGKISAMFAGR